MECPYVSDIKKEDVSTIVRDLLNNMIDKVLSQDMAKSSLTYRELSKTTTDCATENNLCLDAGNQVSYGENVSIDTKVFSLFYRAKFDSILPDQLEDARIIDNKGFTAFDYARLDCDFNALRVLVDYGCKEDLTRQRQTKISELKNSLDESSRQIGLIYEDATLGFLIEMKAEQVYSDKSLELKNFNGDRALSIAADLGDIVAMENLLDAGTIPMTEDLQKSIEKHHAHCIKKLLECGLEFSETMLDQILQVPFNVVIKTLLEKGDIKRQVGLGDKVMTLTTLHEPILHTATRGEILEAVRCIVRAGADVNCKNHNGETALEVAIHLKNNEIIKELLDAGANIKRSELSEIFVHAAGSENTFELLKKLIHLGVDIDSKSSKGGITALMNSIIYFKEKNFNLLLLNNADVNVTDSNGNTALMLACRGSKENMVHNLLQRNALINRHNSKGENALCMSLQNINITRKLIKGHADVNLGERLGNSALILALHYNRQDIVEILLAAGAKVNHRSKDGSTPLHKSVEHQNTAFMEVLIGAGADVNMVNIIGQTPLILATRWGNVSLVECLLRSGSLLEVGLNMCDDEGNSALIIACQQNHLKIIQILLQLKPKINHMNRKGDTALFVYLKYNLECIKKHFVADASNPDNLIQDKVIDLDNLANEPDEIPDEGEDVNERPYSHQNIVLDEKVNSTSISNVLMEEGNIGVRGEAQESAHISNQPSSLTHDTVLELNYTLISLMDLDSTVNELIDFDSHEKQMEWYQDYIETFVSYFEVDRFNSCLPGNDHIQIQATKEIYDSSVDFNEERTNILSILKLLLESGSDVNCRNKSGVTPLEFVNKHQVTQISNLFMQSLSTREKTYPPMDTR
ncbi:hypothetical protein Btru_043869 [Bulinus truncatus]|nr:hypothetical protein Btru_043869 [Bulinus truncatus]